MVFFSGPRVAACESHGLNAIAPLRAVCATVRAPFGNGAEDRRQILFTRRADTDLNIASVVGTPSYNATHPS